MLVVPLRAGPLVKVDEAALAADGCTVETFTVHSPSMGREIKALVILPPEYAAHPDKKYPVLYALHGIKASYEAFRTNVPLRKGLKEKPVIVASFDGDRASLYLDSALPQRIGRDAADTTETKSLFTTFFFDEYIPALDAKYRINPKQRMVTGFSIGGYGALHYMVTKPGMFVSVSSMSGAFNDLAHPSDEVKKWLGQLLGPFEKDPAPWVAADLQTQIKAAVAKGVKFPPIYLTCGTEDKLIGPNREMRDFLKAQGIACEYEEGPGKHDRVFWDGVSAAVLDFHWRSLGR